MSFKFQALSPLKQVLETDNKEDLDMEKYNNLVDFKLQKDNGKKEISRMIYCAAACVYKPMKLRPKMSQVSTKIKLEIIFLFVSSYYYYYYYIILTYVRHFLKLKYNGKSNK